MISPWLHQPIKRIWGASIRQWPPQPGFCNRCWMQCRVESGPGIVVGKPRMNLSFGNGLQHSFMVIFGMVYILLVLPHDAKLLLTSCVQQAARDHAADVFHALRRRFYHFTADYEWDPASLWWYHCCIGSWGGCEGAGQEVRYRWCDDMSGSDVNGHTDESQCPWGQEKESIHDQLRSSRTAALVSQQQLEGSM